MGGSWLDLDEKETALLLKSVVSSITANIEIAHNIAVVILLASSCN